MPSVLFHVVESICIPLTVTAAANRLSESVPLNASNLSDARFRRNEKLGSTGLLMVNRQGRFAMNGLRLIQKIKENCYVHDDLVGSVLLWRKTVHKSAGKSLQGTEEFFRSIFENAQIGISFFNIHGGVVFTNRAFQEMLGYTEKELSQLGKWDTIIHPDERVSGAERYAELVQGKREKDEWEQRFVLRDGRILVTNARFTLIRDAAGKPQYVASLTEDITESKRAQEERNRVMQQMEILLESTGQGIYGIDL